MGQANAQNAPVVSQPKQQAAEVSSSTSVSYTHLDVYKRQVQGCVYRDLREQSAEFVASKGADGNAIGGLLRSAKARRSGKRA